MDVEHLVNVDYPVDVEHLVEVEHLVISSTLWVKEPIFRILKSFLLSKSQGRQFLVLVINLERKTGPQGGDSIEAAVKETCTAFIPYQNHQVATFSQRKLAFRSKYAE